jgi:hypothetical protein
MSFKITVIVISVKGGIGTDASSLGGGGGGGATPGELI